MKRIGIGLVAVLVLLAIGVYFWLRQAQQQVPPPVQVVSPPPIASPAPITQAKPAIAHPVELPPGMTTVPPPAQAQDFVRERVTELFGAKTVNTHILLDDFARRVAATVDNLGRSLAPPSVWPIRTMPGRFTMDKTGEGTFISPKNDARYAPFVALVESVDTGRAVTLYRLLYPLFQGAYEKLGFPGKYFNDRLVAVIDLLLATPEPEGKLQVELVEIRGPIKPTRPWVLYRFSDPEYEGLSSGQKILLRVGRENAKKLKQKLAEIRKLVAAEQVKR